MNYQKILGHVLKEVRTKKRISQAQLAQKCSLDKHYISKIERGVKQPSLTTLLKIATVLNKPVSQIFADVDSRISWRYAPGLSVKSEFPTSGAKQ